MFRDTYVCGKLFSNKSKGVMNTFQEGDKGMPL